MAEPTALVSEDNVALFVEESLPPESMALVVEAAIPTVSFEATIPITAMTEPEVPTAIHFQSRLNLHPFLLLQKVILDRDRSFSFFISVLLDFTVLSCRSCVPYQRSQGGCKHSVYE